MEQLGLPLCLWSVLGNQEVGRSLHAACAAHPGLGRESRGEQVCGSCSEEPRGLEGRLPNLLWLAGLGC